MTTPAAYLQLERLPLRGICVVMRGRTQRLDRRMPPPDVPGALAQFPQRPNPRVVSESIPLFFMARNKIGLWVAREAEGRTGGIFLFQRSALRFARKNGAPAGCATMLLAQRLELDVENRGPVLTAWLEKFLRRLARLIPDHPPPIAIRRRNFIGDHP